MRTGATAGADELLRVVHEAAYRFPVGFAGFTAVLTTHAGDTGTVTVRGRRNVEVALSEGAADAGWARDELTTMVANRWASEYADGDGRWSKRVVTDTHLAGGLLVTFDDDPFRSAYQIRDGQIAQVHRTAGHTRFVIAVQDRELTGDGRSIPSRFTVFHWSAEEDTPSRLLQADHYCDAYRRAYGAGAAEIYLPARREVISATDDGLITRFIELHNHTLTPTG